jgi:hypothetical protein
LPINIIKSEASYGGASLFSNVVFNNFKKNSTYCGNKQAAIAANEDGADYHPSLTVKASTFNNVD